MSDDTTIATGRGVLVKDNEQTAVDAVNDTDLSRVDGALPEMGGAAVLEEGVMPGSSVRGERAELERQLVEAIRGGATMVALQKLQQENLIEEALKPSRENVVVRGKEYVFQACLEQEALELANSEVTLAQAIAKYKFSQPSIGGEKSIADEIVSVIDGLSTKLQASAAFSCCWDKQVRGMVLDHLPSPSSPGVSVGTSEDLLPSRAASLAYASSSTAGRGEFIADTVEEELVILMGELEPSHLSSTSISCLNDLVVKEALQELLTRRFESQILHGALQEVRPTSHSFSTRYLLPDDSELQLMAESCRGLHTRPLDPKAMATGLTTKEVTPELLGHLLNMGAQTYFLFDGEKPLAWCLYFERMGDVSGFMDSVEETSYLQMYARVEGQSEVRKGIAEPILKDFKHKMARTGAKRVVGDVEILNRPSLRSVTRVGFDTVHFLENEEVIPFDKWNRDCAYRWLRLTSTLGGETLAGAAIHRGSAVPKSQRVFMGEVIRLAFMGRFKDEEWEMRDLEMVSRIEYASRSSEDGLVALVGFDDAKVPHSFAAFEFLKMLLSQSSHAVAFNESYGCLDRAGLGEAEKRMFSFCSNLLTASSGERQFQVQDEWSQYMGTDRVPVEEIEMLRFCLEAASRLEQPLILIAPSSIRQSYEGAMIVREALLRGAHVNFVAGRLGEWSESDLIRESGLMKGHFIRYELMLLETGLPGKLSYRGDWSEESIAAFIEGETAGAWFDETFGGQIATMAVA